MTWRRTLASVAGAASLLSAQANIIFLQERNDSTPRKMKSGELKKLQDPFFQLVLKSGLLPETLADVERRLQPDADKRKLFAVSEEIAAPSPELEPRAVITFEGTSQGIFLKPNVMLSVFFNRDRLPSQESIEVLAWDDKNGRFNFYKLERSGNEPKATWKFRGSSEGADIVAPKARAGTCLVCHMNGAPIQKELTVPWNNWHSPRFPVPYLDRAIAGGWPIVQKDDRFLRLTSAETLESDFITPSINQFNLRRIAALVRRLSATQSEVTDARRLLRPLFQTTEFNIASALQLSGVHPIGPASTANEPIQIPHSFFLNSNLIAGDPVHRITGLGITEARFNNVEPVQPAEYNRLVQQNSLEIGGKAGDSFFAWFVPEPSHVDVNMIDRLIGRGMVTRQFVAAVLAVDLETPVFSAKRASLTSFVPTKYRFQSATGSGPSAHPDELTRATIKNLEAKQPAAGSAEKELLDNLKSADPLEVLRPKVVAYRSHIVKQLAGSDRDDELRRLFDIMVERRQKVMSDPLLQQLRESKFLFGLP